MVSSHVVGKTQKLVFSCSYQLSYWIFQCQFEIRHQIMIGRIKEELETQYQRYSRNKCGKLVALFIYCMIFTQVPLALKYLIPSLMQVLSPQTTFVIVVFGAMATVGMCYNLFLLWVYKAKLPFFERYRVDASREWPWEKDSEEWKSRLLRTIGYNVVNLFVITPLLYFIDSQIEFTYIMDMEKTPTFVQMFKYMIIFHILEDFFFFTTHALLHTPFLYKHIHKIHHQYNTTVTLAGLHFHAIQFLISNSIPAKIYFTITAYILGPIHISVIVIWMILRILDAYNGHSGYNFSWTILQLLPFCANDEFHEFHHSHNCGNYGSQFRFWDSLFDTNKPFREFKKKQLERSKENKQK